MKVKVNPLITYCGCTDKRENYYSLQYIIYPTDPTEQLSHCQRNLNTKAPNFYLFFVEHDKEGQVKEIRVEILSTKWRWRRPLPQEAFVIIYG